MNIQRLMLESEMTPLTSLTKVVKPTTQPPQMPVLAMTPLVT